jgi:hypothetical protein
MLEIAVILIVGLAIGYGVRKWVVSPRPLSTTAATSVLTAHSPTLPLSRERGIFHGSKVAKRTDSFSGCGRIAFARSRQTADRHSTDLPPSQPRPRWRLGGAFVREASLIGEDRFPA